MRGIETFNLMCILQGFWRKSKILKILKGAKNMDKAVQTYFFVSLYRRWNHLLSILESYLKHNKRLGSISMKFVRP